MSAADAICIGVAGQYDGKNLHLAVGYPYSMTKDCFTKILGFHLIEILIVIAIIGILATFSWKIYTLYLTQTYRMEAKVTLSKLAIGMEQYHLDHHTYEGATLETLHFPSLIAHNLYQLTIQSTHVMDYLLAAIPLQQQAANDRACGHLTLNANNEKGSSGTSNTASCW